MNLNHVHLGTKNLLAFQEFYKKYFDLRKNSILDKEFLANSSNFFITVDPMQVHPELPDWYYLGFCLENES